MGQFVLLCEHQDAVTAVTDRRKRTVATGPLISTDTPLGSRLGYPYPWNHKPSHKHQWWIHFHPTVDLLLPTHRRAAGALHHDQTHCRPQACRAMPRRHPMPFRHHHTEYTVVFFFS
ncbi:hypothetical protein PsorP6_014628 [Peronosclerospora sorghi]|uniref:Uncharacterized protein n=1 Tax=Peronosclerospora sorghi TaxID=230839 RepID=A0ACC0VV21_9STRA|nr:hypothetical protein PsorP6_014628 [Peronosclerospora sorghi]